MRPLERYGKVRINGTSEYGEGYGNLGGFDTQIVTSAVERRLWVKPSLVSPSKSLSTQMEINTSRPAMSTSKPATTIPRPMTRKVEYLGINLSINWLPLDYHTCSRPGHAYYAWSQACFQGEARTSSHRTSYATLKRKLYPLPLLLTCCQVSVKASRAF